MKYATETGWGHGYRSMSDRLRSRSIVLNHSSCKNHLMRCISKLIYAYAKANDLEMDEDRLRLASANPMAQDAIGEMLRGASK